MKKTFSLAFLMTVAIFSSAFAQSSPYPYSDTPADAATQQAIQDITERGIVSGYSDGSFRPGQLLNRAEYMKIIMNLQDTEGQYAPRCFPDVPEGSWFEPFVCRAKTLGIVHGYPPADGCIARCTRTFQPLRNVNYGEALKVLIELYDVPVRSQRNNEQWYERYLDAAIGNDLDLGHAQPGDMLTRGNMALLVYGFIVFDAERGETDTSSSSSKMSSSSSSRMSASSSSSSRSLDPFTDTSPRSQIILLGETTPMLGAASFFSDAEPLNVTRISVDFGSIQNDITMLLFYDQNRQFLGTASVDTSVAGRYTLRLAPGTWSIPRRTDSDVYVRARLRSKDEGGVSNAMIQISQFVLEGNGAWSGQLYTKASTEMFDPFITSRSVITSITNAGPAADLIISGPGRTLGTFRFQGRSSDSSADVTLLSIVFSLTQNNVSLSNVRLGADATSETVPCSVGSSTVTCASVSDVVGSLTDGPRTLTLYGDITLNNPALQTTYLQTSLNTFGTATTSGNITFRDGTSTFDWVPLEVTNVNGTRYAL